MHNTIKRLVDSKHGEGVTAKDLAHSLQIWHSVFQSNGLDALESLCVTSPLPTHKHSIRHPTPNCTPLVTLAEPRGAQEGEGGRRGG